MGFKEFLQEAKIVNLDKGDDPVDIKNGTTVISNKTKYTCIDTLGDNYSFLLKDKKGNQFLYNGETGEIEEYDY